jgi:hypothetical protein
MLCVWGLDLVPDGCNGFIGTKSYELQRIVYYLLLHICWRWLHPSVFEWQGALGKLSSHSWETLYQMGWLQPFSKVSSMNLAQNAVCMFMPLYVPVHVISCKLFQCCSTMEWEHFVLQSCVMKERILVDLVLYLFVWATHSINGMLNVGFQSLGMLWLLMR